VSGPLLVGGVRAALGWALWDALTGVYSSYVLSEPRRERGLAAMVMRRVGGRYGP